ncbi:MAG: TSCPD domain-containing protein [Spirochaetota bacterium]
MAVAATNADEVVKRIKGIDCQNGTSCPDQLAKAILAYRKTHAHENKKKKQPDRGI